MVGRVRKGGLLLPHLSGFGPECIAFRRSAATELFLQSGTNCPQNTLNVSPVLAQEHKI